MKRLNFRATVAAGHLAYMCQAAVNNFAPLLFVFFSSAYGLTVGQISLLIAGNFGVQLLTDLVAASVVDRTGYRAPMLLSLFLASSGLILLALLPDFFPPFPALLTAMCVYAVGGGLSEVLVSPIVEACPTKKKSETMGLLHSSYCFGVVAVVLFSTLFFVGFGVENWQFLALLWAILPLADAFLFLFVPVGKLPSAEKGKGASFLFSGKFWLFFLLLFCAGAAEVSVAQWISRFAELGLRIDKTAGDIAGPCLFALLMGLSRIVYSRFSSQKPLLLLFSGAVLCVGGFLLASLAEGAFALLGCALVGVGVAPFWPGIFSICAEEIPNGGGGMFAFFALAGDLGCCTGPMAVGFIASAHGGDLSAGLLFALVFPAVFGAGIALLSFLRKKRLTKGGRLD